MGFIDRPSADEIRLDGANIYQKGMDIVMLRQRVGMVFQRPNPFPNLSVRDNVLVAADAGAASAGAAGRGDGWGSYGAQAERPSRAPPPRHCHHRERLWPQKARAK